MSTETPIQKVRLSDALTKYRHQVSILKKGYKQESYRIKTLSNSFLGEKYVHLIASVDIASYRDVRLKTLNPRTKKPLSGSTVRLEMALLSHFFDLARIEWGFTNSVNPCSLVRKPKVSPGRSRRLGIREEKQILTYSRHHSNRELYPIIILALETAMRQGEIISLEWQNIDFSRRVAHLPDTKNGHSRDVPLSAKARQIIIDLGVQRHGFVFNYTSGGIKSTWRFMMQKLGISDLHFHDLRHEATSRLFELNTLNTMEVAAITGHKSLSMLKRYTHLEVSHLAHKLDGNKNKTKAALLKSFIPYPCAIEEIPYCSMANHVDPEQSLSDDRLRSYSITFPDFTHSPHVVNASSRAPVLQMSQQLLAQLLLQHISLGNRLPRPDQHQHEASAPIVMVDPLGFNGIVTPAP